MKRKIKVLFVFLVLISFSASVFAEIPKGSVIIGKKGFTFEYANNNENTKEIRNAIKSMKQDEEILIKNKRGDWYRNNGKKTTLNPLTEISYTMNDGSTVMYKGESLKQEDGFSVLTVSFVSRDKLEIMFSEAINDSNYMDKVKVEGYLDIKDYSLSSDKKRMYIKIDPIKANMYDANVYVSKDIKNNDGIGMTQDFAEVVSAFTKTVEKDRTFDSFMSITNYNFVGENLKFNKPVVVTGDRAVLKKCYAKELILNPGSAGEVTLENIEADKIIIYSGASSSIHMKNSKVNQIEIKSYTNTRIVDEENNDIQNIEVYSDAIIQTKERINSITVKGSKNHKNVKVIGKVSNVNLSDNSSLSTGEGSKIDNVNVDGKVQLKGNFGNISSEDMSAKIEIKDGTSIENIQLNEDAEVEVSGSVEIDNVEGAESFKEAIREKLEDAKIDLDDDRELEKITKITKDGLDIVINQDDSRYRIGKYIYKYARMSVTFDEEILTDKDRNGVLIYIYGSGRLIDVRNLELIDNSAKNIRFYYREQEDLTFKFYLEKEGRTIVNVK